MKADVLGAIEQATGRSSGGSHKAEPFAQDGLSFGGLLPETTAPKQVKVKERVREPGAMEDEEEL